MNDLEVREMIQKHEGFRSYVYKDTLGFLTGGYGHAFLEGSLISQQVANALFEEDFTQAKQDCVIFCERYNLFLDPARRGVIVNMLFNMGISKLSNFKKFIAALQAKDHKTASAEMRNSLWAKQTKNRAVELAKIMEEG